MSKSRSVEYIFPKVYIIPILREEESRLRED